MFDEFFAPENNDVRAQAASFLIACLKRALDGSQKKANRVVARSFDLSATSGDGANRQIDVLMPDDWTPGTVVVENPNGNGSISIYRDGIISGLPYATVPPLVAKVVPVAPECKRITLTWPAAVNSGTLQVWLLESTVGYDEFGVGGTGGGSAGAPSYVVLESAANGNVAGIDAHGSLQFKIVDSNGNSVPLDNDHFLRVSISGGGNGPVNIQQNSGFQGAANQGEMLATAAFPYVMDDSGHEQPLCGSFDQANGNGNASLAVTNSVAYKVIAAGTAANTSVKGQKGRLARVIVTATGTNPMQIEDGAVVVAIIPANAAVGAVYDFDIPCGSNITVVGNAANPGVTVTYI